MKSGEAFKHNIVEILSKIFHWQILRSLGFSLDFLTYVDEEALKTACILLMIKKQKDKPKQIFQIMAHE